MTTPRCTRLIVYVPFDSKRRQRAQLLQKLQHVVPSLFLLTHGITRFSHAELTTPLLVLASAEVVTAALVMITFLRQVRHNVAPRPSHAGSHKKIDWLDVFLAGMLLTEAFSHQHETGHLPRPTVLTALVTLALGVGHGRLGQRSERRRRITIDDNGILIPGRFFTRWAATWKQLAAIDITATTVQLRARDGRVRLIDLTDVVDPGAVRTAMEQARGELEQTTS